ncbi:MAG: hypothetical protein FWD24_00410 [Treponema sp.]|nr:hypothetical protein [Treponema sp.]
MNKNIFRKIFSQRRRDAETQGFSLITLLFFAPLRLCVSLFSLLFLISVVNLHAQVRDDSAVARQYVQWVQQAINEERWDDASAALLRASDFENVSSDISYLRAIVGNYYGMDRNIVVQNLSKAIDTNRWVTYNENQALLFITEQYIALRNYTYALNYISRLEEKTEAAGSVQIRTETAIFRLLALRGMATHSEPNYDQAFYLAQFRSHVLLNMDRFPRDPRPLRIFFEYARNRKPEQSELPAGDINLLELILRRLPFLLETDPELAWLAAPFIRDNDTARRLIMSYRSGGIPHIQNRDFMPHPASIAIALNLGLIDDIQAARELFSGNRGFNYPLAPHIKPNGNPVLNKDNIIDVYKLLRGEEGRDYFTRRLHSFTGIIYTDDDNDGYIDSCTYYVSGIIQKYELDRTQDNVFDFEIFIDNGVPVIAKNRILGHDIYAHVFWERYPSVKQIVLGNPLLVESESFMFGPADFQYTPVTFIELGGSDRVSGLLFPVVAYQYIYLTRRSIMSFCSSLTRPSLEIDGALETIYMNRGIILQAVEVLNGQQVSVTEFDRGLPVIQYIDLDLDGRMETIRRFRFPPSGYTSEDLLDYRRLISSSESDWSGDGRFKTMEVYQLDGSVVYYFDMDGSGQWTYSETGNQR